MIVLELWNSVHHTKQADKYDQYKWKPLFPYCCWKVKFSSLIPVIGYAIDGAEGLDVDDIMSMDIDYTMDFSVVTAQFEGFTSDLHGVMAFEWAIGTSPGGEEVQSFMTAGIIHEEDDSIPGDGEFLWKQI